MVRTGVPVKYRSEIWMVFSGSLAEVCVCVRVCVRACVCACMRACVRGWVYTAILQWMRILKCLRDL